MENKMEHEKDTGGMYLWLAGNAGMDKKMEATVNNEVI